VLNEFAVDGAKGAHEELDMHTIIDVREAHGGKAAEFVVVTREKEKTDKDTDKDKDKGENGDKDKGDKGDKEKEKGERGGSSVGVVHTTYRAESDEMRQKFLVSEAAND
jgi:hypothetical protein